MAGLTLEAFPEAGLVPPLHPDAPPRLGAVAVSGAEAEVLLDVLRPEVLSVVRERWIPAPRAARLLLGSGRLRCACAGGSTGTPRAPLRSLHDGGFAARGSPLWTTGTSSYGSR